MSDKTPLWSLIGSLAAVILGALGGIFAPDLFSSTAIIGQLFLNALTFVLIPLIIAVSIQSVFAFGDTSKSARTVGLTVLYFLGTAAAAVVIATGVCLVTSSGAGIVTEGASTPDVLRYAKEITPSLLLSQLVPANLIVSIAQGQYFGLIILAMLIGGVLMGAGPRGMVVGDFFRGLSGALSRLTQLLTLVAPIGLLFLTGAVFADNQANLGAFTSTLFGGLISFVVGLVIFGFLFLPALYWYFTQKSPVEFVKSLLPAIGTSFGTGSSVTTLPVTYSCVVEHGIDTRAAGAVLPLGSILNMGAQAILVVVATYASAEAAAVSLSFTQVLTIGLLAVVIPSGLVPVPGASIAVAALIGSVVGLPEASLAALGVILGGEWLFSRLGAVVNVLNDAFGAAIIGESFAFKTATSSNQPQGGRREFRQDRDRGRQGGQFPQFREKVFDASREGGHAPQGDRPRRDNARGGERGRDRGDRPERTERTERQGGARFGEGQRGDRERHGRGENRGGRGDGRHGRGDRNDRRGGGNRDRWGGGDRGPRHSESQEQSVQAEPAGFVDEQVVLTPVDDQFARGLSGDQFEQTDSGQDFQSESSDNQQNDSDNFDLSSREDTHPEKSSHGGESDNGEEVAYGRNRHRRPSGQPEHHEESGSSETTTETASHESATFGTGPVEYGRKGRKRPH
jgi:Na+/H+-dicarboxylate symporter